MNHSTVFKYRKTGIIKCIKFKSKILNEFYKTEFVNNLFSIKIDLLAFSLSRVYTDLCINPLYIINQ